VSRAPRAVSVTRAVAPPWRGRPEVAPPLEHTEVVPPRSRASAERAPRRGWFAGALTAAALAVSVTALAVAVWSRSLPEVQPVQVAPGPPVGLGPSVRSAPRVAQRAAEAPPPAPPPAVRAPPLPAPRDPAPARRGDPVPAAVKLGPPTAPRPEKVEAARPSPDSPEVTLARLQAAASRLRDSGDPALRPAALQLLAEISLARASADPVKKAEAAAAIERRLKAVTP